MMRRLLDALLRRPAEPPPRQLRPNELRREVVQAERRQREARATVVAPGLVVARKRPAQEHALAPPEDRTRDQTGFPSSLKTRAGLRQAWLVKELLDAPVGMRGPYRDR